MKVKKKRILGLLGLFSVSAVTAFAVFLPQTGVFATSSVTDTITVTVKNGAPHIEITDPEDGAYFSTPQINGQYNHTNVSQMRICVQKLAPAPVDEDECAWEALSKSLDHTSSGTDGFSLNLSGHEGYGYGRYKLTIKGKNNGVDNVASHSIVINYNAINPGGDGESGKPTDPSGGVGKDPETNEPVVNPHATDPNVHNVHVNVFQVGDEGDAKGPNQKPDREFDIAPNGDTRLNFTGEDCGEQLPVGWYLLEFQAQAEDGSNIGIVESLWFYWEGNPICEGWVPLAVPNTGGMFGGTNITREDSLITVAIIFVVAAVLGAVLVARKRSRR